MNRDSRLLKALPIVCLAALLLICFHRVLFGGHQFAYRDAAHYYYPLYERVQHEWDQGRWPLWEPEENSGMPLLGNPTAAVLYPGKVLYALFPYAWGARLYIIAHVVLAFGAMMALMRSWRASWTAAGLSALAYAFSGPILFQYCNVIYLVGAAWLPLGFLAVDRWTRLGSRRALLGLAFVLAMQTLGGDPQSAYLLGLCAGGYAAAASWTEGRGFRRLDEPEKSADSLSGRRWWVWPLIVASLIGWAWITLELARVLPGFRPHRPADKPTAALPWMLWAPRVVPLLWGLGLLIVFARRRAKRRGRDLERLALGLGASAALAVMLTAAQLWPVIEFTQRTVRAAGEGPHDIYPFSLEPYRLVELFWPNVFGTYFGRNANWMDLLKLSNTPGKIWVPSLYMGALAAVLALRSLTFRRGGAHRVWLSWIIALAVLGSLGQYTSPIWAARWAEQTTGVGYPGIGPLDQLDSAPLRMDRFLRDGDGGVYWAMTTLLPGFRQFRFPSKLMTFAVLGVAALAGFGWDDLKRGRSRGTLRLATAFLGLTVVALVGWLAAGGAMLRAFERSKPSSSFGPFEPSAAFGETAWGLGQAALILALAIAAMLLARRRPRLAGALALAIVAADLAVANHRMIATAPQALFEVEPEVARIIREAESEKPSDGPFRIHRMAIWNPPGWYATKSDDRVRDFLEWERATLQPKYGINLGIEYTHTVGVAELYDYEWYFGGFLRTINASVAAALGAEPGRRVVYYPRRAFDMWNTRYFVLPSYPGDWTEENRGYAAFMPETEPLHPPESLGQGPEGPDRVREWVETKDYQIRRNLNQFPRAWVVHQARTLRPMKGMSRDDRAGSMQEIIYANDALWHDATLRAYDPRQLAWIEAADAPALRPFTAGFTARPSETVEVSYPSPTRVELTAKLDQPGIVVLADVFYPGWRLSINGEPATIYRVNRMMRGAAVEAGTHKLVYTYEPNSFRFGGMISLAGLAASVILALYVAKRPRSPLPWAADAEAAWNSSSK